MPEHPAGGGRLFLRWGGWCWRGLGLGGCGLFRLLVGGMVADSTAGRGAEHGMVAGNVTGNAADSRTRHAARIRGYRRRQAGSESKNFNRHDEHPL